MAQSRLKLQIVTFNCGRKLVDLTSFSSCLFRPYTRLNTQNTSSILPDIVVLNLQEIAPIAYSFIGGTLLTPYFASLAKAVQYAGAQHNQDYELVIARNVGMTAIVILATPACKVRLQVAQVAGVGVGDYGLGNKGAVGVRLKVESSEDSNVSRLFTFVSAHLAPMEDGYQRRNLDWENIVRGLAFHSEKQPSRTDENRPLLSSGDDSSDDPAASGSGMLDSSSIVFFAGDLNYRTSDFPPKEKEHMSFLQPEDCPRADGSSTSGKFQTYLESDQLNRERSKHKTLHTLHEAPFKFPPTYKFSQKAQDAWPKNGQEPDHYHWSTRRFPSWCDRILCTVYPEIGADSPTLQKALSYSALALQPTSDHRPVTLATEIDLDSDWWQKRVAPEPPFPLKPTWREDRVAERRRELIVGLAALLTTTVEGLGIIVAIAAGSVGGWFLLKAAMVS